MSSLPQPIEWAVGETTNNCARVCLPTQLHSRTCANTGAMKLKSGLTESVSSTLWPLSERGPKGPRL